MFRFSIAFLAFLILGIIATFFYLANKSQNMEGNYSFQADRLAACPVKPNCVSSFQEKEDEHYIAPLPYDKSTLDPLIPYLRKKDYEIKKTRENYIYVTKQSDFFGFVDDVEFLLKEGKIFFRSQSRVGYSDLGANRSRIEGLKFEITQNL